MSTIFVSHSSTDNALAVELHDWLSAQGYRSVFLDLDPDNGIEAGERWEKVLYRELISCSVVLALVTENWLTSKWCFAEATHARSSGKNILGLLVNRSVQPAILADIQLINYAPENRTDAYQRLAKALQRAIDPQGLGRWDPTRPLFPGLLAFDEQDAPIFFGRRRASQSLYQKLKELQAKPPGSERLLLVFGPSGSGKSSLVRAGVLPHVHANPDAWITLGPFRPAEGWPEPLRQSIDLLSGSDEQGAEARLRELVDHLRHGANTPKATVVIIIDQLEEALDMKDGAEESFWLPLSRLLGPPATPFMAIATLRSDFMEDFQKRSARNPVRFATLPIEPMAPEDLREVIVGPCLVAGIDLDPGLTDALVGDTGNEQALPLLALALNRLWLRYEAKQGGFTVTDYRNGLGGMRGLIDREAENTLAGKGLREAVVLDAFLNLTRLAREGVPARQLAAWDELEPEAQHALEPFISARLLVRYSAEDQGRGETRGKGVVIVELIHEALLSGWTRLHNWLVQVENRDFLLWREELRHKVSRWAGAENKKSLLLVGPELKEAKKWLRAKRLALTAQEAKYVQAGIEVSKASKIKYAVAVFLLTVVVTGWWGWTHSDIYQVNKIVSALPELTRVSTTSAAPSERQSSTVPFKLLVRIGRTDLAIAAANKIERARQKGEVFVAMAAALVAAGQTKEAVPDLERALAAANRLDDPFQKAIMLGPVAAALAIAGQTQQGISALGRAQTAAEKIVSPSITHGERKKFALQVIAEALAVAGQADQALATADKIDGVIFRANAFRQVALALAVAGQTQKAVQALDQALATADKYRKGWDPFFLGALATALAVAGQADQALTVADRISDAEGKLDALGSVAAALLVAGQTQKARQTLERALTTSDTIDNEYRRAGALEGVLVTLAEAAQTQEALPVVERVLTAADKIDNPIMQARTLEAVAKALAATGQTPQAIQTLERALTAGTSPAQLTLVADEVLVRTGQADRALAAAEQIHDVESKVKALQSVARAMADVGLKKQAKAASDKTLRLTESMADERTRSGTYGELASLYAQLGEYRLARVIAEQAKFSSDTLDAYVAILKYHTIKKYPGLAGKIAKLAKQEGLVLAYPEMSREGPPIKGE